MMVKDKQRELEKADRRVKETERALLEFQTEQLDEHLKSFLSHGRALERHGPEIVRMLEEYPALRNTPKLAVLDARMEELMEALEALQHSMRG